MILVSRAVALSPTYLASAQRPVACWENVVTFSNLDADSELASYPSSNLANPDTDLLWRSGSIADQYLTVTGFLEDIEAVAIARHNLGSAGVVVSVEAQGTTPGDPWAEVFGEFTPGDDDVLLLRFEKGTFAGVRVKLQPGAVAPQAAVLMIAPLTVLQRLPPGHTPITFGDRTEVVVNKSQRGDYLGRIVTSTSRSNSVSQQNLDPIWYRETLEPFRRYALDGTFVFAWSPYKYPAEVGYCWLTNDPQPQISQAIGLIDIQFALEGITS